MFIKHSFTNFSFFHEKWNVFEVDNITQVCQPIIRKTNGRWQHDAEWFWWSGVTWDRPAGTSRGVDRELQTGYTVFSASSHTLCSTLLPVLIRTWDLLSLQKIPTHGKIKKVKTLFWIINLKFKLFKTTYMNLTFLNVQSQYTKITLCLE